MPGLNRFRGEPATSYHLLAGKNNENHGDLGLPPRRNVFRQGSHRQREAVSFHPEKIYAKFTQYESHAALGVRDSVIVQVTPEKKFSWGFD
jgi:hypothetical protein